MVESEEGVYKAAITCRAKRRASGRFIAGGICGCGWHYAALDRVLVSMRTSCFTILHVSSNWQKNAICAFWLLYKILGSGFAT